MARWFFFAFAAVGFASSASALDVSGSVGAVSEYRDRGISLSQGRAAVQGAILVEDKSGLYAEVWGSSVGRWPDGELDLSAGWAGDLDKRFGLDLYATLVAYPWDWRSTYVEGTAALSIARGPATLRTGVSVAPAQRGTRDEAGRRRGNVYGFTQASYELRPVPLTINAAIGYENGAFDTAESGGKWDWSAGAEVDLSPARIGLSYVGSDSPIGDRHAVIGTMFLDW